MAFGILGLGLAVYVFTKLALFGSNLARIDALVFATTGVIIGCLGIFNFYLAYGFKYGRVSEVTGTMEAATLIRHSKKLIEKRKIAFVRHVDLDDAGLDASERSVLFFCAWRPWVCLTKDFMVHREATT